MRGKIIRILSGYYDIESTSKKIYRLRASGNLREKEFLPLVGDNVEFEPHSLLKKINPRINFLKRPKVANIDQVLIVFSIVSPNISTYLLDKWLAIFESKKIKPLIVLTKIDLGDAKQFLFYQNQGYQIFTINNLNFDRQIFKNFFKNKVTVVVGTSGVGKSTLITNLTKVDLKVGVVSHKTKRGKHTTRVVEMIDFQGGKLIDTPGFSAINFDLTPEQLAHAWHDFAKLSLKCFFGYSCLHYHEKRCAVKEAFNDGIIYLSRYQNYLKLLKEIQNESK